MGRGGTRALRTWIRAEVIRLVDNPLLAPRHETIQHCVLFSWCFSGLNICVCIHSGDPIGT